MREREITVVIVTYHSRSFISNALNALKVSFDNNLIECVLVDNASDDGIIEYVQSAYPWVQCVQSGKNVGFGKGCNLGFQQVETPYVLIHNPDALIDYDSLVAMLEVMKSDRIGITAPAILEESGAYQKAGLILTPAGLMKKSLGMKRHYPRSREIEPASENFRTPWICGAMMLIRSELYTRLEGFDPRFFLYFEETDFCKRASDLGYEIWAVGNALAKHIGGACAKETKQELVSSCISEHFYRSRFYYLKKHHGLFLAVLAETIDYWLDWGRSIKKKSFESWTNRPFLKMPDKV